MDLKNKITHGTIILSTIATLLFTGCDTVDTVDTKNKDSVDIITFNVISHSLTFSLPPVLDEEGEEQENDKKIIINICEDDKIKIDSLFGNWITKDNNIRLLDNDRVLKADILFGTNTIHKGTEYFIDSHTSNLKSFNGTLINISEIPDNSCFDDGNDGDTGEITPPDKNDTVVPPVLPPVLPPVI